MNNRERNIKKFFYLLHGGGTHFNEEWTYYINNLTTQDITTIRFIASDAGSEITVPETIDGYYLNKLGVTTFTGKTDLISVTIGSNIIEIE